jgi:membrane protein YdbS with pleckstrin-like domain
MQKRFYADKTAINSLRLFIFAVFVIAVVGLYILFLWLHKTYPEYFRIDITTVPEVIIIAAIIILTIVYIVIAVIILPRWFEGARYTVSFEEICAETGVIIHSSRHMMMSSVQYITRARFLLWVVVVVHASGGLMAVPFMSKRDSDEFIKKAEYYLSNRGGL